MTSAIKVQDISVNYDPRVALSSVSLLIGAGEIVGLVGPNGCGKSTLIRAITRVVPLSSGKITLLGEDVSDLSQRQLARLVAVVPQNPNVPDNFRSFDLVMLGRTPHLGLLQSESERDLQAVHNAMIATDTWHLADRLLGEISGGERQRVVISRALAQETPVLLLDEPTAHLDIGQQAATMELLESASSERSLTVLVAMHDLTLAARYCQRLVMLSQGRLIAEGRPEEVLREELLADVYTSRIDVFSHPYNGLPVVTSSGRTEGRQYGNAQDPAETARKADQGQDLHPHRR